jgi:hypothetical protein
MFYQPSSCGGCSKPLSEYPFGEEFLPYLATKGNEPPITIYLCNVCTGIVNWTKQINLVMLVQYRVVVTKQAYTPVRTQAEWLAKYWRSQQRDPKDQTDYEALQQELRSQQANYQAEAYQWASHRQAYKQRPPSSAEEAVEYINQAESPAERHARKRDAFSQLYGTKAMTSEQFHQFLKDLQDGKTK